MRAEYQNSSPALDSRSDSLDWRAGLKMHVFDDTYVSPNVHLARSALEILPLRLKWFRTNKLMDALTFFLNGKNIHYRTTV